MKTIEVDPRVPGIRDEIPFPRAKQCSPELDSPRCKSNVRLSEIYSVCRKTYRHRCRVCNLSEDRVLNISGTSLEIGGGGGNIFL